MKPASGFVTEDGTFFETEEEAELHEAKVQLEALLDEDGIRPDAFFEIVNKFPRAVRRYVHAHDAAKIKVAVNNVTETSFDLEDHITTEEGTTRIFKQSLSRGEPVPDMGSSVEPEEVRLKRPVDGSGSGKSHARSLRRRKDMATRTRPETS